MQRFKFRGRLLMNVSWWNFCFFHSLSSHRCCKEVEYYLSDHICLCTFYSDPDTDPDSPIMKCGTSLSLQLMFRTPLVCVDKLTISFSTAGSLFIGGSSNLEPQQINALVNWQKNNFSLQTKMQSILSFSVLVLCRFNWICFDFGLMVRWNN